MSAGSYLLEFWHIIETHGGTSTFRVDVSGAATYSADLTSNSTYQYQSYVLAASAGSLTIQFTETSNGGYNTVVDDVSLSPLGSVPEPGSMLLMGIGAAGLFLLRRRR